MTELGTPMKKIRRLVVASTQDIHLELHEDPVLRHLVNPDVALPEYLTALTAFFGYYHQIEAERRRLDMWSDLSLIKEQKALQADVPSARFTAQPPLFHDDAEMLGGLYVAHGASFGRSVFCKTITRALPDAPKAFVSLRTTPDLWRELVTYLETSAGDPVRVGKIETGAGKSFALMKSLTSELVDRCP